MASSRQPKSTEKITQRDARRDRRASHYREDVNRWAIIVGISKYQHEPWNLKYAHRDAEEFCKFIQTRSGGEFKASHITKLIDEQATTGKITRALRSFLKKPAKEDLVLLYFACHGTPDPDRPENMYLLTHDTDPKDIAGTALPMREITLSLRETLHAERVVIIADTCHSAAIAGRMGRSVADRATEVNKYLQSLSQTKAGMALLTSAEATEVSREGDEWGGGHGVFTHFLLQGMRGDADGYPHRQRDKDGKVGVGELFEYVRDKVREETNHQQHPSVGTNPFDRNLPMAWTGGIEAQQHHKLACHLYELGWILDDKGRFESAVRHFDEAIELSPEPSPQAHLERGRALLALEEYQAAIQDFQKAMEQDKDPSEASFYLGIAYAKQGEHENAVSAFETYLERHPEDDRAPWIRELVDRLSRQSTEARYALLIGIGKYVSHPNVPNLRGPANDVQMMRDMLVQLLDFAPENITELTDEGATRQGILKALGTLQEKAGPGDAVLVFYSGHAFQGDHPDYLIVHDTVIDATGHRNTIDAEELHEQIVRIRAARKILVFDTHATNKFTKVAREQTDYTLFLATSPDEAAFEHELDVGTVGLFTYAFVRQLQQSGPDATQRELLEGVVDAVQSTNSKQTPLLFGNENQSLFVARSYDEYLAFFDNSQRRNYAALTLNDIYRQYASVCKELSSVSFPQLHYRFGCAFLEKGLYTKALQALLTAIKQREHHYPEATLALGITQLRLQRYGDALETLQRYPVTASAHKQQMQKPLDLIEQLQHDRRHALLVGINQSGLRAAVRGAVNDVHALKRVLTEKYGFQEADVKLLINGDATRQAIIKAFHDLVKQAREKPALFYFAGAGSLGIDDTPAIVSADGHNDIRLRELAAIVGDAPTNLVAVIDAGWKRGVELPWEMSWGSRFASPPFVSRDVGRGWRPDKAPIHAYRSAAGLMVRETYGEWQEWQQQRYRVKSAVEPFKIGRLSIYQVSIQAVVGGEYSQGGEAIVEIELPALDGSPGRIIHGALTLALVSILQGSDPNSLTYAQLAQDLVRTHEWLQPYLVGNSRDAKVFSNTVKEGEAHALLNQRIWQEPIRQTIPLLERLIEQRNGIDPEAHLDLGIAYAALGDYDNSVAALKNAIEQQEEQEYAEASYHLGRVLFESGGDLDRAVSELRDASKHAPDIIPVYYYLGQAIRTRVEREAEALVDAERAFDTYLKKGAPLGKQEEVRSFLRSRRTREQELTR